MRQQTGSWLIASWASERSENPPLPCLQETPLGVATVAAKRCQILEPLLTVLKLVLEFQPLVA